MDLTKVPEYPKATLTINLESERYTAIGTTHHPVHGTVTDTTVEYCVSEPYIIKEAILGLRREIDMLDTEVKYPKTIEVDLTPEPEKPVKRNWLRRIFNV